MKTVPKALPLPLVAIAAATLVLLAAGCGGGGGSSGSTEPTGTFRFEKTTVHASRERSYTLVLPPDYYTRATSVPLVVAMHGGGGNAAQFESTNKLSDKAHAAQFAVVYPNGTGLSAGVNAWNAGGCCGAAVTNNVDDVGFIGQMLTEIAASYRVDAKRVYATGHSNGGMMAYRLACELPSRIAAIAPNAAALVTTVCTPSRGVPSLHMHSRQDFNVPVAGGVGVGISGVSYPSLATTISRMAAADGCPASGSAVSSPAQTTRTRYSPCQGGAVVELLLTDDGGHAWPGGLPGGAGGDTPATSINANEELWAFFQRFTLP